MALSKVKAAEQKIGTGADLREEMVLMMGPYANWENFLAPAPMCISLLGELICISTAKDFSLDKTPPKDGFKLLRWPHSFRASLIQVSNAGYDAFSAAHKNMDQIRLLTANVPGHLRDTVNIVMKGSNEELEDLLPIPMTAIESTADQCLVLADSVESKFESVMQLIAELLEASTSAKGEYEQELRETKIALKFAKENKKAAEEQKEMSKKAYDELVEAVKKAEDSYYKAMDSMPGKLSLVGMNAVDGLSKAFTSTLDGVVSMFTVASKDMNLVGSIASCVTSVVDGVSRMATHRDTDKTAQSRMEEVKPEPSVGPSISKGRREAYILAIKTQQHTDQLVDFCVDDDGRFKQLPETIIDNIIHVQKQLRKCLQEAKGIAGVDTAKNRLVALCMRGDNVCTRVRETSKALQSNAKEENTLVVELRSLQEDVISLSSEGRTRIETSPTDTKGPIQRNLTMEGNTDASAAMLAVQSARFKIEQASANLQFTREKYNKACDKMMDTSKQVGEILGEISKLDMTKVDFEKIRKTLIMGIKAIAQLREEWANIVKFFNMMSNLIKCTLNVSLKDFLQYANNPRKHSSCEYPVSSLKRDMIYQVTFHSAKIAYLVNMISSTYVEVSQTYLLHRLAGVGKMMGYDPETQGNELARERQALFRDMQDAQAGILALVKERKAEFSRQITARINKIRSQLEEALPVDVSSSHDQKRIQSAVQRGVERAKQETKAELAARKMDTDEFV